MIMLYRICNFVNENYQALCDLIALLTIIL